MKIIDLTHTLTNGMSTYPSDPDVFIVKVKDVVSDRTLLHRFSMGTHTGTHLDVPAHVIIGGKTLDDFPISTFSGRTVRVDEKTFNDLDKIEENIDGIIYDAGWYIYFNDPKVYFGPERPEIPNNLLEKAVELRVKYFGCDLPSVDASGSQEKPIHNALLGENIIVYESLTNLNQLPLLTPFQFYGFPLPFVGLDGSPIRAIGVID